MPMTRHQATGVALQAAKAHPEAYMSAPDFKPHRWVTTAIMLAAADTPRPQLVDLIALKMAVISAGLGICALSERDLLDRLEELCIHGVGIGARSMRAVIEREISTELACHEGPDRLPIEAALRSLAARLQAPSSEPESMPMQVEPSVPTSIIQAIQAYGDARADRSDTGAALANVIKLIRTELAARTTPTGSIVNQTPSTAGVITEAQISAGAAITTMDGKPIGRNTAIDAFHAMCNASGHLQHQADATDLTEEQRDRLVHQYEGICNVHRNVQDDYLRGYTKAMKLELEALMVSLGIDFAKEGGAA